MAHTTIEQFATELKLPPGALLEQLADFLLQSGFAGGPMSHPWWGEVGEEADRSLEALKRAILEALPDLMFLQTRDGVYLDFHARDPRQLLARPEEFLGRNMTDVLPPSLAAEFRRAFARATESGGPCAVEYFLPIQGELRHYEARVVRCDRDNVLSIVRDITERRRAEEGESRLVRFVQSYFGLQTLGNSMSTLGLLITGLAGVAVENPATMMLASAPLKRAIGRPLMSVISVFMGSVARPRTARRQCCRRRRAIAPLQRRAPRRTLRGRRRNPGWVAGGERTRALRPYRLPVPRKLGRTV